MSVNDSATGTSADQSSSQDPVTTGSVQEAVKVWAPFYSDAINQIVALKTELKRDIQQQSQKLIDLQTELDKQQNKLKEHDETIRSTETRGVQIISTFAAVIALVLVYSTETHNSRDLAGSILIVITGALSLILFAVLVNFLLEGNKTTTNWGRCIVLIFLTIISSLGLIWCLREAKIITFNQEEAHVIVSPALSNPK